MNIIKNIKKLKCKHIVGYIYINNKLTPNRYNGH